MQSVRPLVLSHLQTSVQLTISHPIDVYGKELEHLRSLIFLRQGLLELKGRKAPFKPLQFVRDEQFILETPYVRASFDTLVEANRGNFSLITSKNLEFLWFENQAFDILRSLKCLGVVDFGRLPLHANFYDALVKEATRILEYLDTLKEVEWNIIRYNMEQKPSTTAISIVDTCEL